MQRRDSSVYPIARYAERHTPHDDEPEGEGTLAKPEFQLGDPMHSEDTHLGTLRNRSGHFINCKPVQLIMTTMIVGNALLLGILTLDVVRFNSQLLSVLEYLDLAILISFTIEVCFIVFTIILAGVKAL
jgi:hypothetical protein